MRLSPSNRYEAMSRWPRIVAHVICHSLGYATPSCAAQVLLDAKLGHENWCEWIYTCHKGNPRPVVKAAIRNRHHHKGYMAEYRHAKALVDEAVKHHREPLFMSWS